MSRNKDFLTSYGPWALVVGASAGLGAAFVRELARQGFSVLAVARNENRLHRLADEESERGRGEVRPLVLDVLAQGGLVPLYEAVAGLDVGLVIYNVGYPDAGTFLDRNLGSHRAVVTLNSLYPLDLAHHFGERMRGRKRGGILLLSSLTSLVGSPRTALYGASKAFDMVLAEGIAYELAQEGIDVSACASGVLAPDPDEPPLPLLVRPLAMRPARVARTALAALKRGGTHIPGLRNKLIALLIGRILPRRLAVALMAITVRALDIENRQRTQRVL